MAACGAIIVGVDLIRRSNIRSTLSDTLQPIGRLFVGTGEVVGGKIGGVCLAAVLDKGGAFGFAVLLTIVMGGATDVVLGRIYVYRRSYFINPVGIDAACRTQSEY